MITKVIVDITGFALIALVAWYFWFSKKKGEVAGVTGGVQEAFIVVKGGYTPDVIVVKAGKPVRFVFERRESSPCSERVVFKDFKVSTLLPEGEKVIVEFTPEKRGEYEFACQMGMFRGRLIVEGP
ncbi:MAG: cupredoxin domain-containing protein [Thermodesulfobacteriota bacterium]